MVLLELDSGQYLALIILGIPVLIFLFFISVWITRYVFKIDKTLDKQDEIIRLLKKLNNEDVEDELKF